MALTTEEQELLDWAMEAMPPWFRGDRDLAVEAGIAKMMGAARAQVDYWAGQTLIASAAGATSTTPDWLQQHAIDRGTRRQYGESDAELRARLRFYPDAITPAALLGVAQGIVDAAGVATDAVAMVELRADKAFLVRNVPQDDVGGTFDVPSVGVVSFAPVAAWSGNRPPWISRNGVAFAQTAVLTITGAADSENDGAHNVTGMSGDALLYAPGIDGAISGSDGLVGWRVDRYAVIDGAHLTAGSGKMDAYASRGFRVGGQRPVIVLILPYGTTAATSAAVEEAIRQRKAAGVIVLIETRESP